MLIILAINYFFLNSSSSSPNFNSAIHTWHPEAIYTSRPTSALTSSTTSRKRNIEELNIEPHDNG